MLGLDAESCKKCLDRQCVKFPENTLNFCHLGVAFYNNGCEIVVKEESVTLRHVARNLRHELNKVLQTIIKEASTVDDSISIKKIDIDNPASRIVGATLIIDQFIEMITGVNEFYPSKKLTNNIYKKAFILDFIEKYKDIYSLIHNTRRSSNLNISIDCCGDLKIGFAHNIIEYIISIFIDNIWKYSINHSDVEIHVFGDSNYININFINYSAPIKNVDSIFEKGYQEKNESEGFGFGLYWATVLIDYYNDLLHQEFNNSDHFLAVTHKQSINSKTRAKQSFLIRNIKI